MHHIDWSYEKGGTIGFIFSTMISLLANISVGALVVDIIIHLVLGGFGALGGILVSKWYKKYIEKK